MRLIATALALSLLIVSTVRADNWPSWRGPNQSGTAAEGDYPLEWTGNENVAFKIDLPGQGSSTPAIWGDQIFITAADADAGNLILAYDRQGTPQWEKKAGKQRPGKHKKATGANPSPVTDGEHVYAYFKSGDLICVDTDGKLIWQHNLQKEYGEDTLWWDLGTSPVLTGKYVVVAVMQSGPSYLIAYDKATGEPAWKQDRMLPAPSESAQSYSTPVVVNHDGSERIIVLGADHVTSHDAATGAEIWRVGGLNPTGHEFFRSIASPVVDNGIVVAPYGRGKTLVGVEMGGTGDVTKSHTKWNVSENSPDVPSPAAANGKVYVLSDKGLIRVIEISSGKELDRLQLEKFRRNFSASPILAGGHLYCTREDGTTFVVKAGDKLKLVAKNELGADTVATPVLADGKVYLRTYESLYCIGK